MAGICPYWLFQEDISMHVETAAEAKAYEAIEAAAKAAFEYAVRVKLYQFSMSPSLLDELEPGLSRKSPRKMRTAVIALIDEEMLKPHRNFGFGGEIPLVILHGALRYAETCCAIESGRFSR
jgi:hypothetical protein